MEEEKNKIYTVVALVVVAGLLFSCFAGAVAGGLSGFVAGRRQARKTLEGVVGSKDLIQPWSEERPFSMPHLDEKELPFDRMPGMMPGALVVEVIDGSPADEARLRPGDVIVAVDQTPIDQHHQLADVIGQYEPGDRVTLEVLRVGEAERIQVKLGRNPEEPGRAYLGIYYEMMMGAPDWEAPRG